ncbi:hypothetical protein N7509_000259 [Penicillium cosmopolitanum]|uniref:Uncharacterized protein n=1 Tax=Penicillium cosmopolitanum TaxID=1131564 RepID=A0A9W9WA72_9EURO|nr:uncharacterized protein N7509_000259 [Penicillium cosmopolitanum]KAJ5413632.1 hypothetical protein N7509_000259 [Penicillium cosmopolitanum]
MEIDGIEPPTGSKASASTFEEQATSNSCDQAGAPASDATKNSHGESNSPELPLNSNKVEHIKTLIEESLDQMHTRLVENGAMVSPLGKAFICILDHESDLSKKNGHAGEIKDGDDPITGFLNLVCVKFKRLSSALPSNAVQGPGGLNLLRICCEWILFETLLFSCFGTVVRRKWLASPAQELYYVSREGVEDFQPLPLNGAKPWKDLQKTDSAPLESWTLQRGFIVNVDTGYGTSLAKVSDIRCLDDGRYIVVYTWLYTRDEIAEEFEVDGKLSTRDRAYLDKRWPLGNRYRYMLSTNRTVTLWDTAIGQASEEMTTNLCCSAIYSTTPTSRRIWSIENPRYKWMKRILIHEPHEPRLEDTRE